MNGSASSSSSPPFLPISVPPSTTGGAFFDSLLPDDVRTVIALHLEADDILRLVSATRAWSDSGRSSTSLWKALLLREAGPNGDSWSNSRDAGMRPAQSLKGRFLHLAQMSSPSSVRWRPVVSPAYSSPTEREGHGMCVLGGGSGAGDSREWIVLHGGFTNDESVHFLDVGADDDDGTGRCENGRACRGGYGWDRVRPSGEHPPFVYGASLTAIDGRRAVRFGGFRSGGYSNECAEVFVLTVGATVPLAQWERVQTRGRIPTGRAYHTATLLGERLLVFVGGMTDRGSIMNVVVLDTETWTWIEGRSEGSNGGEEEEEDGGHGYSEGHPSQAKVSSFAPVITVDVPSPSGRHGHSVVLDAPRNRFVMFGGGSGSDLLRSGVDNSEVWELLLGSGWEDGTAEGLAKSFPWRWRLIHEDSKTEEQWEDARTEEESDDDNGETEGNSPARGLSQSARSTAVGNSQAVPQQADDMASTSRSPDILSPSERLCLGRCHVAAHISPSSVIFAFGAGRPSTNGVLSYDLRTDEWRRLSVSGPLPPPRFTCGSAVVRGGWLVVHGGFCAGEGSMDDVAVLDLAPRTLAVARRGGRSRTFGALPPWEGAPSHRPVKDDDIEEHERDRLPRDSESLMSFLLNAPPGEQQERARHLMGRLIHAGGAANQQLLMWLMAVAEGRVELDINSD